MIVEDQIIVEMEGNTIIIIIIMKIEIEIMTTHTPF